MSYDMLKLAVEGLSSRNTVVLDDRGMPSIMVRVPKFKVSDVIDGATQDAHHMFIVDGVEKDQVLISKYQNIVKDGRAYSLPMMDPKHTLTFDQAKAFCEAKGPGFHLLTNAERAGLALWSKKNGTMPRGNNNYGADISAAHEKGIATSMSDATRIGRIATGSGPASWAHDGTGEGIYDLNGNVWEWMGGMRIVGGEIQVIVNNNAAMPVDQGVSSTLWKAILEDGTLVAPGTTGTLKYDGTSATKLSKTVSLVGSGSSEFKTLAKDAGITTVPQIAKALGLFPVDALGGGDRLYVNSDGERLPYFGGNWPYGANAGVFAVILTYPRSVSSISIGFRSAYIG